MVLPCLFPCLLPNAGVLRRQPGRCYLVGHHGEQAPSVGDSIVRQLARGLHVLQRVHRVQDGDKQWVPLGVQRADTRLIAILQCTVSGVTKVSEVTSCAGRLPTPLATVSRSGCTIGPLFTCWLISSSRCRDMVRGYLCCDIESCYTERGEDFHRRIRPSCISLSTDYSCTHVSTVAPGSYVQGTVRHVWEHVAPASGPDHPGRQHGSSRSWSALDHTRRYHPDQQNVSTRTCETALAEGAVLPPPGQVSRLPPPLPGAATATRTQCTLEMVKDAEMGAAIPCTDSLPQYPITRQEVLSRKTYMRL